MKFIFYLSVFLLAVFSCTKSTPTFKEVDLKMWIEDKNGCSGKRSSMRKSVDDQKEKLLGLSEVQTVELLGSPDSNELYKRNQKFYYYFIGPSPACSNTKSENSEKLVIRFNAIGLSNDVSIE